MAHPGHNGSPMQLSPQEQSVVEAVAARRDGLVALTSELVAFDTMTHMAGAPPRLVDAAGPPPTPPWWTWVPEG